MKKVIKDLNDAIVAVHDAAFSITEKTGGPFGLLIGMVLQHHIENVDYEEVNKWEKDLKEDLSKESIDNLTH